MVTAMTIAEITQLISTLCCNGFLFSFVDIEMVRVVVSLFLCPRAKQAEQIAQKYEVSSLTYGSTTSILMVVLSHHCNYHGHYFIYYCCLYDGNIKKYISIMINKF